MVVQMAFIHIANEVKNVKMHDRYRFENRTILYFIILYTAPYGLHRCDIDMTQIKKITCSNQTCKKNKTNI